MPVPGVKTVKLIVAYDGGEFHGFQRQREEPTVQSVLEKALNDINGAPTTVRGAGRTDAGVHAWGQVVAFCPRVQIPEERWPRALNRLLPPALLVRSAQPVGGDFDPVRDARWKHYRYEMSCGAIPSPFEYRYVHQVPVDISVASMRRAARLLIGRRDFASFQVSGRPAASTVRRMYQLGVVRRGERIIVDLVADGFLYKMARSIVGTLIAVGGGQLAPEDMRRILDGRDRSLAGPTAPPQGLCMMRVYYGDAIDVMRCSR